MDTVTKAPQTARSTDRLLEALSTLAALLDRTINEVKSLDSSFQERLLHAVHVTEVSLQSQAAAHLEKALAETEEEVRKELTRELKTQFDVDMKAALASVHSRMAEEFDQKAAFLQSEAAAHLEKTLSDTEEKVRRELTGELQTQFDVDMKEALASDHSRMTEEFDRKAASLQNEAAAHLEQALIDNEEKVRKELTRELQTQFGVDMKEALASDHSRMTEEFDRKAASLENEAAALLEQALIDNEEKVRKELTRELQTQFGVDMKEALASDHSRMAEEFDRKAASLQNDAAAHLEQALIDNEEKVRKELTRELQTQFGVDMKEALASDHSRMAEEFDRKAASLQNDAAAHLEQALIDNEEKVRKELTRELQTQFDADIKEALASDHSRLAEGFNQKMAEMAAQWEEERQTLMLEIGAATEKAKAMVAQPGPESAALLKEMEKIAALVASISAMIDDPSTELSLVIRKNVERAELESYLKGIRFAVGK